MRAVRLALLACGWLAIVPAAAHAQGSIAGAVRDTSGAVLPGVTVEVASPALIEKVRTAVTDGTGQYRIENLQPGQYTVTFTLAGFSTVKQEGVPVTGTAVSRVNTELRVGALEETITVTGETPVVDVQSTTTQRVLDQETIDALPSGRIASRLAGLLPGVTQAQQDVGGILGDGTGRGAIISHGVKDAEQKINGMTTHTTSGGTGAQGAYNIAAYVETVVDTAGIGAEQKEGGVRINLIPRDGGNTFRTFFFASLANDAMQGNNVSQELKDRGLREPDSLRLLVDVNPAIGGPIKRDRLWFHTTARYNFVSQYAPMYFNKNTGNPNAWTYEPDLARGRSTNDTTLKNSDTRLTFQATPKNKFGFTFDTSRLCDCGDVSSAIVSPEAGTRVVTNPKRQILADWSSPATSRLLFESGVYKHNSFTERPTHNLYFPMSVGPQIRVTEQSTGLSFRAMADPTNTTNSTLFWRFATSYITGEHAYKVGVNLGFGAQQKYTFSPDSPISYRFNNGVPNRITQSATPFESDFDMAADHGLFFQDKWALHKLTMNLGLRYDYFHISFPETKVGPGGIFARNRNIVFPKTEGVRWHDLEPRLGVAYDLFGDGKTALKASLGKYMLNQLGANAVFANAFTANATPAFLLVTTANRSWNDANRNFIPECDLQSALANGECGALDNADFGVGVRPAQQFDPKVLNGWNVSGNNWQFSTSIQREILPQVSLNVGYFRTWFSNLLITDNRALVPADYDPFSITAPLDPRLPDGGGYVISGLYDLKPAKFGIPADNYLTFTDSFGKQNSHWNGIEFSSTARPFEGLTLQGGTSSGRTATDNCEVVSKADNPSRYNCHVQGTWLTQVKFLGSYLIPQIDLQLSATLQSVPGPEIAANYNATNAVVAPSLGRNLSGGASNVTVNLISPGSMYGDRLNQLDVRVAKILRFGRVKTTLNFDLYNALNVNAVLTQNNTFGAAWQQPQSILNARFAKVGVQLDF